MIMRSRNDFSLEHMVSGYIDSSIIPDGTFVQFHSPIMVEGTSDHIVPKVNVLGGSFYALMGFFDGQHDHGPEVFRG